MPNNPPNSPVNPPVKDLTYWSNRICDTLGKHGIEEQEYALEVATEIAEHVEKQTIERVRKVLAERYSFWQQSHTEHELGALANIIKAELDTIAKNILP